MIPYSIVAKIEWCKNNQSCLLAYVSFCIYYGGLFLHAYAQNYVEAGAE